MSILAILFSYSGRINRFEFWIKGIIVCSILFLMGNISIVIFSLLWYEPWNGPLATAFGISLSTSQKLEFLFGGLVVAYSLVVLWRFFALVARRYHDRSKSGWWGLVSFIPLVGAIWIIVECGFLEGTDGDNAYGPKP